MPHGQNATHQGHDVFGARDVPDVPSVPDVPGAPGVSDVPDVHDVRGITGPRGGYPWTARRYPYGFGGPKPMIPMAVGVQSLSRPQSYQ